MMFLAGIVFLVLVFINCGKEGKEAQKRGKEKAERKQLAAARRAKAMANLRY